MTDELFNFEDRHFIFFCDPCGKEEKLVIEDFGRSSPVVATNIIPDGWEWYCIGGDKKFVFCKECSERFRSRIIGLRNEIMDFKK